MFTECFLCSRHGATTFLTYTSMASSPYLLSYILQMERIQNVIMWSGPLTFGLDSNVKASVGLRLIGIQNFRDERGYVDFSV